MNPSTATWTAAAIPDLSGLRAVVTGANSGLGFHTSLELAQHGAEVTMACRSAEKGAAAVAAVQAEVPEAAVRLQLLDLADLSSVRSFAGTWNGRLDLLVDNAGVMAVPYGTTVDGFERQLGTNHLGHFALTGLLLPALQESPAGRVVVVSSLAHLTGYINLADLQSTRRYSRWAAYGQSKLANLLFMRELTRRLSRAGSTTSAAAAHPGLSDTGLVDSTTGGRGPFAGLARGFFTTAGQPAAAGALPSLYAATMPDVVPGDFFGPANLGQSRGGPTRVGMNARARDAVVGQRLWEASERLTGVTYDLPVSADR